MTRDQSGLALYIVGLVMSLCGCLADSGGWIVIGSFLCFMGGTVTEEYAWKSTPKAPRCPHSAESDFERRHDMEPTCPCFECNHGG